jgi:endoglucanase
MACPRNRRAGILALLAAVAVLMTALGATAATARAVGGHAASAGTAHYQRHHPAAHHRKTTAACRAAKRHRRKTHRKGRPPVCATSRRHHPESGVPVALPRHHHKTKHSSTSPGTVPTAVPPPSTPPVSTPPVSTPTLAPTPSASGDPLAGDQFDVNPADSAVIAESQLLASGQTAAAGQIETIASQPEATWLTSDGSTSVVPGIMSAAAKRATVPIFALYNIPWRDCGQYSSGGASSAADYEGFINAVVSGLGQGRAVVIVEPDALSELSCLSSSQQQTYYQLIGYAAQQIDSDANASVYVDAGNPGWLTAGTEASGLQQALGATRAGFAVNASNFASTASDVAYGTAISQAAGGRHFVIDTSRNGGNAAGGQWCNPPGAGIGVDPTTNTGNALVDADLWIKDVGESDGTCNGGPAAGEFWLSYALDLVANG